MARPKVAISKSRQGKTLSVLGFNETHRLIQKATSSLVRLLAATERLAFEGSLIEPGPGFEERMKLHKDAWYNAHEHIVLARAALVSMGRGKEIRRNTISQGRILTMAKAMAKGFRLLGVRGPHGVVQLMMSDDVVEMSPSTQEEFLEWLQENGLPDPFEPLKDAPDGDQRSPCDEHRRTEGS